MNTARRTAAAEPHHDGPPGRRRRHQRTWSILLGVLMLAVGLAGVERHTYHALGGLSTKITNTTNTAASAAATSTRCRSAAVAASAFFVYPFDEASGTTAADVSGNNRPGTYSSSGITYGASGPCDAGKAVTLDGSTGAITGASFALTLLTFSEAVWFKTSTTGGLLVGVGNAATGASTAHDRALYVSDNGAVNFEVQPLAGPAVITSPATYKDGAWHLAVATFSATTGMNLYVDGALVRSNASVTTALALGVLSYWRIGYDSLSGVGSTAPANAHFSGGLSYASVYNSVLSATQVSALYNAKN